MGGERCWLAPPGRGVAAAAAQHSTAQHSRDPTLDVAATNVAFGGGRSPEDGRLRRVATPRRSEFGGTATMECEKKKNQEREEREETRSRA